MLPPFQKLHKQERATLTILHCLWGGPVWRGHSCPRMRKEGSKSLQRKRFETAFTPGGQECPPHTEPDLLDFDHRASVRKLLLDGLGFLFGNALFYRLGRSVNQLLGFFQAQAGDFADSLDHVDLVGTDFLEHDGEFRLLFRRSRRCCSTAAARHHDRGRRRCRHAKTRFEFLYQFRRLEQRQPYYRFFNLCQIRHVHFSSYLVFSYFRHPQTRFPVRPGLDSLRQTTPGIDRATPDLRITKPLCCVERALLPACVQRHKTQRARVPAPHKSLHNLYASLNFFSCTPWSMTTARLRPTAFITVARRWAGALIRNSSFE